MLWEGLNKQKIFLYKYYHIKKKLNLKPPFPRSVSRFPSSGSLFFLLRGALFILSFTSAKDSNFRTSECVGAEKRANFPSMFAIFPLERANVGAHPRGISSPLWSEMVKTMSGTLPPSLTYVITTSLSISFPSPSRMLIAVVSQQQLARSRVSLIEIGNEYSYVV